MISAWPQRFLLEISRWTGIKETSLLPKSAHCAGLDFTAGLKAKIEPAAGRFPLGAAVPIS
jgi:D-alanine-D-alanine ligase